MKSSGPSWKKIWKYIKTLVFFPKGLVVPSLEVVIVVHKSSSLYIHVKTCLLHPLSLFTSIKYDEILLDSQLKNDIKSQTSYLFTHELGLTASIKLRSDNQKCIEQR